MQTYMVGGAVRDALLGLPVNDRDWVVVGATPQQMAEAGYLPVGRDFPVFLHPKTREEYALARTERKTAPGYRGFAFHAAPDVTLEDDLARRDLTINAMAQGDDGKVVDPFGGAKDLELRVLRHVTDAFREDPVRILRVARFAARFHDFEIAPETMELMREMVRAGEVDALVPERVWQELSRGLMEGHPVKMFDVLRDCSALERLMPELDASAAVMSSLQRAAAANALLPVRFACVAIGFGDRVKPVCERLRVPSDCRELAEVVSREHAAIDRSGAFDAEGVLQLLERCDAIRKPQRFSQVLQACECIAGHIEYPPRERLAKALQAALAVSTAEIAEAAKQQKLSGPQIGEAVHAARARAVSEALG